MKHSTLFVIVVLVWTATLGAADPGLVVTPIWRNGQVLVSFELSNALTPEVRDTIQSGLPTTFSYEIDVTRETTAWFKRTMASVTVTSRVQFDNLTRRYHLSRTIDGRLDDTRQTDDQEAMSRWLTRFDLVPVLLTSTLEKNGEYAVRVRVQKSPRNAWFPLPWDRSAILGNARFTFLP
jgi:hypothetical protein